MPQNKDLTPVNLPMDLKFGQECSTTWMNNLEALKVELIDHPTRAQAHNVAWQYVKATWADSAEDIGPRGKTTPQHWTDLSRNLEDVLCFRALPTPMECLGFTFKLSGLSSILSTIFPSVPSRPPDMPALANLKTWPIANSSPFLPLVAYTLAFNVSGYPSKVISRNFLPSQSPYLAFETVSVCQPTL